MLSLPEEVLRAAVFGVRTERRKGRNGEMKEEKDEKQNGIHVRLFKCIFLYHILYDFLVNYVLCNLNGAELQRLSTATVVPIMSGEEAEKENGNGEKKEEREEEGESEGRKWMEIVDVRQVRWFMNACER